MKFIIILFLVLSLTLVFTYVLFAMIFVKENKTLIYKDFSQKHFDKAHVKGYECEQDFNRIISHFIGKDDYLFTNLILKNKKQHTGEIDSILISRKGIFCIEIKSTKGLGRGSDSALHWRFYQNPKSRSKTNVENPVMQNKRYCDLLQKDLNLQCILQNIVVFPNATDLSNIRSNKVFTTKGFLKYFKSLSKNVLIRKDIFQIVDKLKDYIYSHHNKPKPLSKEQMSSLWLS